MSDEPPWSRLPHDPAGFFGLPPEFDRRDLKRAYRDLARRFKPDRAPDEFQRIRAAYEELAAFLASGARAPTASEPPAGEAAGDARAAEEAYLGIVRLLARGEHSEFWSALLDALDRFPDSGALLRTLHEAYREPPSVSPELLAELAVRRPGAEILVDAIPLWDALLKTSSAAAVVATFQRILEWADPTEPGLMLLRLYLIRRLLFQADADWLDEQLELLRENLEEVPGPFSDRVVGFEAMLEYRKVRSAFLAAEPVAVPLDRLIELYTEVTPTDFWLTAAGALGRWHAEPEAVQRVMRSEAPGAEAFRDVLRWLVEATRERLAITGLPRSQAERLPRIRRWADELIRAVRRGGPRSWRWHWWRLVINVGTRLLFVGLWLALLVWIFVSLILEGQVSWQQRLKTLLYLGVLAAGTLLWARRYFRASWHGRFFEEQVPEGVRDRLYQEVMAPRVYALLAEEGLNREELLLYLDQLPNCDHWTIRWLVERLEEDLVAELQSFALNDAGLGEAME